MGGKMAVFRGAGLRPLVQLSGEAEKQTGKEGCLLQTLSKRCIFNIITPQESEGYVKNFVDKPMAL